MKNETGILIVTSVGFSEFSIQNCTSSCQCKFRTFSKICICPISETFSEYRRRDAVQLAKMTK